MKKIIFLTLTLFLIFSETKAFSQPYIGEIRMFAGNYAPAGWAVCNGQLLPIAGNEVLFSLIGTIYGGDGVSNFALPDFRGRVPISFGTGPGIAPKEIGQTGGTENNTLTVSQLPPHTHTVAAVTAEGNVSAPGNALPANTKLLDKEYSSSAGDTTMSASMIGSTGGGAQVNNMQPFLTVTFIIALTGNYPAP